MKLDKGLFGITKHQHRCLVDLNGGGGITLFDRALAKHGQVFLMVRVMPTDEKNRPQEVIENLQQSLCNFAGKVKIEVASIKHNVW